MNLKQCVFQMDLTAGLPNVVPIFPSFFHRNSVKFLLNPFLTTTSFVHLYYSCPVPAAAGF